MTGKLKLFEKLPFLIELFFNGTFILLFSLRNAESLPKFWNEEFVMGILEWGNWTVPIVVLFVAMGNYLSIGDINAFLRRYVFSIIVLIPLIITWGDPEFTYWLGSAHLLSSILSLYDNDQGEKKKRYQKKNESWINQLRLKPAQVVLLSFFGLIGIGAFLLMLPVATVPGKNIDFIDALFMATSATCVTGLATLGLAENFSHFGQIVI